MPYHVHLIAKVLVMTYSNRAFMLATPEGGTIMTLLGTSGMLDMDQYRIFVADVPRSTRVIKQPHTKTIRPL